MKKIAVLEKTNFNREQIARLESLGELTFYENLPNEEASRIAPKYDVIIVNWLDPTPFIMEMKPHSLVALLSTGYDWISNIKQAHDRGIYVANIPGYSTEAVSEHLLGLLLGVSKRIFTQLHNEKDDGISGFELTKKTVGIIGLGNIGLRFAEIMHFFGANVIKNNRNLKNNPIAKDVTLNELLVESDIICVTPSVNEQSKSLINEKNYNNVKDGVVVIGATWDIITEAALVKLITEKGAIAAFDAALEGKQSIGDELKKALNMLVAENRLFLTPHSAYNTTEAEGRQLNICITNIERYLNNTPQNIVY